MTHGLYVVLNTFHDPNISLLISLDPVLGHKLIESQTIRFTGTYTLMYTRHLFHTIPLRSKIYRGWGFPRPVIYRICKIVPCLKTSKSII